MYTMWTISNLVCFFILIVLSLKDIQTHQVSVPALAASASAGVIYHLVSREMNPILILGGILVGVLTCSQMFEYFVELCF